MPYGMLSGRVLDDQIDSTRDLDNQEEKEIKVISLYGKTHHQNI